MYARGFVERLATEAAGVDFQGYLSLAAGGDVSRERDRRAPSAGLNLFHRQGSAAAILQNKIMHDDGAFEDPIEPVIGLRAECIRLCGRGAGGSISGRLLSSEGGAARKSEPYPGSQKNH